MSTSALGTQTEGEVARDELSEDSGNESAKEADDESDKRREHSQKKRLGAAIVSPRRKGDDKNKKHEEERSRRGPHLFVFERNGRRRGEFQGKRKKRTKPERKALIGVETADNESRKLMERKGGKKPAGSHLLIGMVHGMPSLRVPRQRPKSADVPSLNTCCPLSALREKGADERAPPFSCTETNAQLGCRY